MPDETTVTTPPLSPPNGHNVTTAELYEALYNMSQRQDQQHTVTLGLVSGIRQDLSAHTKDGHPYTQRAEVIKEEIKLDAKKAGIVTGLLAVAAAVIAYLKEVRPF